MTAFASTSNLWEAQLLQTTTELEKKKKKRLQYSRKDIFPESPLQISCMFLFCQLRDSLHVPSLKPEMTLLGIHFSCECPVLRLYLMG